MALYGAQRRRGGNSPQRMNATQSSVDSAPAPVTRSDTATASEYKKEVSMDMSDIGRPQVPHAAAPALNGDGSANESERWHELVSQIGVEIAAPLTAAIERINTLTSTGKIDRQGLRALRDEVEAARQVGMI